MTPPVSAPRPPPPRVSCRCWCSLCGTTLVPLCARRLNHFAAPALDPLIYRKDTNDAVRVSALAAACSLRPLLLQTLRHDARSRSVPAV